MKIDYDLLKLSTENQLYLMVPRAGIEPARMFYIRGILNPLRLPVSPPGLDVYRLWRLRPESNRRTRLCRPLHDHSATQPCNEKRGLERETRLELATPTLARLCSTTELFPRHYGLEFYRKYKSCQLFSSVFFVNSNHAIFKYTIIDQIVRIAAKYNKTTPSISKEKETE